MHVLQFYTTTDVSSQITFYLQIIQYHLTKNFLRGKHKPNSLLQKKLFLTEVNPRIELKRVDALITSASCGTPLHCTKSGHVIMESFEDNIEHRSKSIAAAIFFILSKQNIRS